LLECDYVFTEKGKINMDEVSKKEIEDLKVLRPKMIRAMKKCFVFALCCALLASVIATMFVQSRMLSMLLFPWVTFIFSFVISCMICSWKIAGFDSEFTDYSLNRSMQKHLDDYHITASRYYDFYFHSK